MILAMDRGVRRIQDALEAHGLAENTLVVFTSDNGGAGYIGLPDVNAPHRGWKLSHFEGGLHVPFAARWPACIAPGTVVDDPVHHFDLFTTFAAAAGARVPGDRVIDGVDLLPYTRGEADGVPHETLFWRQGHHQTVLHQGWKMIRADRPEKVWLFDLANDPTERARHRGDAPGARRPAPGAPRGPQRAAGRAHVDERARVAATSRQADDGALRGGGRVPVLAELTASTSFRYGLATNTPDAATSACTKHRAPRILPTSKDHHGLVVHATLTSKGQVTVPKAIRDRLHLKPGDKIDFVLHDDGDLRVTPLKSSVTALKGMLPKPATPVTLEQMDDAIARASGRKL